MSEKKEMNIYQKLQEARFVVLNSIGKKSGKNAYAGFEYFELKDFIPQTIAAFRDLGITSIFNIEPATPELPEIATLIITDGNETIKFEVPTADATGKGQLPIQALGSKITYLRRYLYLIALDIVENDVVDALGDDKKPAESTKPAKTYKAKPEDLQALKRLYSADEQARIVAHHKINSIEELDPIACYEYLKKRGGAE